MQFWSALIGAVVGGALSLAGTVLQMRHERKLAAQAAAQQLKDQNEATNRGTAIEMLDLLAQLQLNFFDLRSRPFGRIIRGSGGPQPKSESELIVEDMERIDGSRGILLPGQIKTTWYEAIVLVKKYRTARVSRDEPAEWTVPTIERAGDDVVTYLRYTRDMLTRYVRTLEIPNLADMQPPPDLSRASLEPWQWESPPLPLP